MKLQFDWLILSVFWLPFHSHTVASSDSALTRTVWVCVCASLFVHKNVNWLVWVTKGVRENPLFFPLHTFLSDIHCVLRKRHPKNGSLTKEFALFFSPCENDSTDKSTWLWREKNGQWVMRRLSDRNRSLKMDKRCFRVHTLSSQKSLLSVFPEVEFECDSQSRAVNQKTDSHSASREEIRSASRMNDW